MKGSLALVIAALVVLLAASQVSAFTPFTEGFENYNVGQLDFQGPWWPFYPNGNSPIDLGVFNGVDHNVTPHGGTKMVRAYNWGAKDYDANAINLSYRVGGGAPLTGNFQVDWWFYDPLGPGGVTYQDTLGIDQIGNVPNNADPTNTASSGYTWVQRMTMGASGNQTTGFDATKYQVRVIGNGTADGAYNAQGWFNLPGTTRTVGWHEGRILVSAPLSDNTNMLAFYVDDMSKPAMIKNSKTKNGFNVMELDCGYGAQTGFYDDISITQVNFPASTRCSDIKAVADGTLVILSGKVITATPGAGLSTDTIYVEDSNRAGAIRIKMAGFDALKLGTGDVVDTIGTVNSASGEKYIDGVVMTKTGTANVVSAVAMNTESAAEAKSQGLYVKLTGKVTAVDADNFTINDGGKSVKVMCGTLDKPQQDKMVRVRGVISTDGTNPVLLMNNEQVDWTYGDAEFQPLPLPGRYKYPREYLICGPFADANSVYPTGATDDQKVAIQDYRLSHDFIADATGGQQTEAGDTAVHPSEGDACGANVWTRYKTGGANGVNFTGAYPTNNTYCTFYAHVYIWSPIDQDIAMRAGSDDSLKIIVNGLEIWKNQVYNTGTTPYGFGRGETIGNDYIGYAPLHQGLNSVLLKVEQGNGGAGVDCQFIDPDPAKMGVSGPGGAEPLAGLGYVLNKVSALFP